MMEISKLSLASVFHLYGEVSLLEMDWIDLMVLGVPSLKKNRACLKLADCDRDVLGALRSAVLKSSLSKEELSGISFCGADQYVKDYSCFAEMVLKLINQPLSPVQVVCEPVDVEVEGQNLTHSLWSGFDSH